MTIPLLPAYSQRQISQIHEENSGWTAGDHLTNQFFDRYAGSAPSS
jgi:hypothetical protein